VLLSTYPLIQINVPEYIIMSEHWNVEEVKKSSASTLSEKLGLHELFSLKVWRASLAELVGSAVLVFAIDTIVISSYETKTTTPNLVMAILISITVAILLLATNPISGGHINPVVTLSAVFVGLISLSRAAVYILSQCTGAVLGALALKAVVNSSIEETFSLGGCTLTVIAPGPHGPIIIGIETTQALWLEIICTFVFLFASIWMAFDHRQAHAVGRVVVFSIVGTVVGLLVFISTTVTAVKGYAGVGMNPARCLGPALIRGAPLAWALGVLGRAHYCLRGVLFVHKDHSTSAFPHGWLHARYSKYRRDSSPLEMDLSNFPV
ncbi:plasma membrane intrinsic protein 1A, partial [Prunus dulcis]